MRYYLIAGEASGDLHGSNLVRQIKLLDLHASIRCWGGDLMEAEGATLVKHYRDLAFMGFAEVVANLGTIFKNLAFCKKDILEFAPDALVLIDYPGFNLRIAKWAKQQGIKVLYYISPQVWAWKEKRVIQIKENVDKMLVILPFEKAFYQKWDHQVNYVGHPLVEVVDQAINQPNRPMLRYIDLKDDSTIAGNGSNGIAPIVALLPGSRKQEILKKLPIMLEVTRSFPECRFVVAQAPGLDDEFYVSLYKAYHNVSAVRNQTYDLLLQAKAACVTSGTATLETALFAVPEVVCYKGSSISYQIAKRLIKVKYISLVNLIMDRPVVTELIQDDLTVQNLQKELNALLTDHAKIERLKKDYAELRSLLADGGHASHNAAVSIVEFASSNGVSQRAG